MVPQPVHYWKVHDPNVGRFVAARRTATPVRETSAQVRAGKSTTRLEEDTNRPLLP